MNSYELQKEHDAALMEAVSVAAIVKVTDFDKKKMTVDVQPLTRHAQEGYYEDQPPILSVPIAGTRLGGFVTRPWVRKGDVGIVLFLDQDMDSALASGKESDPDTDRTHSPDDAIFVGGIVAGNFACKGLPSEALVLAHESGEPYLAVTENGVKVKGYLTVDGSISASGDVVGNGVSLSGHKHHYSWTDLGGSGTTGGAQ